MRSSPGSRVAVLGLYVTALLRGTSAFGETYAFATFAGSPGNAGYVDGAGTAARFHFPVGLAMDARGNLFVTDGFDNYGGDRESPGSAIRLITRDGVVTTLAGSSTSVGFLDGTGNAARFRGPSGVALDANGNLLVADTLNGSVRRITPEGVVTTFARGLFFPYGVAVDAAGNVFVTTGQMIQKITSEGVITPFAGTINGFGSVDGPGPVARFTSPSGLAIDSSGNLFVAEYHNQTIRRITPDGVVTTLAGLAGFGGSADGTGSAARFRWPDGVAVDDNGNVFVTDTNGVRKLTADGRVTTLGGAGNSGNVGGLTFPMSVAVGRSGELYVTDSSRTVRKGVPFLGVLPALAAHPQSQTAMRGRIAVFNVSATGSPAPSYQWTRNGTALPGATEAMLLLTNVTTTSAGTYQCIVTNAGGSVVSYTASLTVVDAIETGRFSNFSVQTSIASGRNVTAGFVVEAPRQKTVLVRGIGPGLEQFGIRGALADPVLAVISSAGERLAGNDNWPAALAGVFASVGAFALPAGSKDAAVVLPLRPGAYSVVLSGADGGAGDALIEIYEVP